MSSQGVTEQADMSFEDGLSQLSDIIEALEAGQVPLEKAVSLYEEGVRLQKICTQKLNQAKMRLETVDLSNEKEMP